jgi:DNA-directed RNA polymerase subunit M/transcription elongation factor TFIIS
MVNEYTKYDPTLPRINTIKCPNQACDSNEGAEQEGGAPPPSKKKASTSKAAQEDIEEEEANKTTRKTQAKTLMNREVMYIRYDDINMKYVYLCVHCNTMWRTDNRI